MKTCLRALTMAALLAALAPAALAASTGFDPTSKIPLKIEPADRTRFLDFDATRQRTVPAALAGVEGNDAVALQKILVGDPVAIAGDRDLIGNWRCRSAQLDDGSKAADHKGGAYVYPYFKCAIRKKDGKLFFEKLNGSQRVSGFLYRVKEDRYAFLGGTDLAEDPQVPYGYAADRNVVAYLFKISDKRLRLELPNTCCSDLEILELVR
jgi:hypothetical protein